MGCTSGTARPGRDRQKRCVWQAGRPGDGGPDLALSAEDDRREQVVVQVLADPGQVGDDIDAMRGQLRVRPDAGQQQQLRRADRSAGDDHLGRGGALAAAVARPLHAGAACARKQQPACLRPEEHAQVGVVGDVLEVGNGGRVPHTLLDAELHVRDAVLGPGVVVRVERDPCLLGGGDDRLVDGVGVVAARDRHDAVARGGIAAFDALEHGPHVVPRPAVGAAVGPVVVVLARAAHPDHGVQTARAAEHAPARPAEPPIGRVALRHGLIRPIDLTQPQLVQAPGVVDGGVDVRAAGLEQEYARSAVDQAPRSRGTRRAGADDDDVGGKAGCVGVGNRLNSKVGHDFSGSGRLIAGRRLCPSSGRCQWTMAPRWLSR